MAYRSENQEKLAGRYLTFLLDGEQYGIPVLQIKEIVGLLAVRPVPRVPEFCKGVINLRGQVIPVIDLQMKLGLPDLEHHDRTCIVVVEAQTQDLQECWSAKQCDKQECPAFENMDRRCWMISGTHCRGEIQGTYLQKMEACRKCEVYLHAAANQAMFTVGLLVDEVVEVTQVSPQEIELVATLDSHMDTSHLLGVAKTGSGMKLLLDVNRILSDQGRGPSFQIPGHLEAAASAAA